MKYAILEKNVRYNENLSANEKLLYAELMLYQEDSKVELEEYGFLFKLLGAESTKTLSRYLKSLEGQNLIKLNKLSEKGLSLEIYSATKPNPKPRLEQKLTISSKTHYAQTHSLKGAKCSVEKFVEFCMQRQKQGKKKLSDKSLTMLINKINAVDNLQKADKLLDEAMEKGWASIYPKEPKAQSTAHQTQAQLQAELQSKGYDIGDVVLAENNTLEVDGKIYQAKQDNNGRWALCVKS